VPNPTDGARARTPLAADLQAAQSSRVENYEAGEPVVTVPAPSDARIRPKGSAPTPISPRGLNVRSITHNGLTWVDIIHPGEEEIDFLRHNYGFHPLHLDDTLSKIQRPKIDDADDYTFIVVHFPVYSKLVRITTPSEVDIYLGPSYLITVHLGNLKPLTRLFKQCAEDAPARATYMGRSAGYLLYTVVDKLVDYCFPILNKIDQNIEQIEDEIFEEKVRTTVQEISVVRRDVISFRRIIKPLVPVINSLERKSRPFLHEDMDEYFGDIADHLSKIWDTLEDLKEVIEGLSDTVNSLTNNRTNEVIKVLTIISVILLPLTLITGIYGMNIDLPVQDHPLAFWFVILAMAVVIVGMLGFFKWRKWI
jgi:magnesium transporter